MHFPPGKVETKAEEWLKEHIIHGFTAHKK